MSFIMSQTEVHYCMELAVWGYTLCGMEWYSSRRVNVDYTLCGVVQDMES